jgi:hypothetical protein
MDICKTDVYINTIDDAKSDTSITLTLQTGEKQQKHNVQIDAYIFFTITCQRFPSVVGGCLNIHACSNGSL